MTASARSGARSAPRRPLAGLVAVVLGVTASCASHGQIVAAHVAPREISLTILFIGDAGYAEPGDPVMRALTEQAARAPQRTVVVFHGDNIYPDGLRDATDPGRADDERHLSAQMDVAVSTGALGVFVPGNHDWDTGWAGLRRQEQFLQTHGSPAVVMMPTDGCPGPQLRDLPGGVRLVALDTQWWLEDGPKPLHPSSPCPTDSESEVLAALADALAGAGDRQVVVVGHHPLQSGGPHGGYFDWRAHIFPLRELAPWLWVPLPVLGSLYPVARNLGIDVQDLSSAAYRRMRTGLDSVLGSYRPLVFAAGHDHNLQVIEWPTARYVLVTGGGPSGHQEPVARLDGTRFAVSARGFVRLDFTTDRRARLGVYVVDDDTGAREAFAMWLDTPPSVGNR